MIITGSKTLYHAGDTDFIPEMADLAVKSIDIAFLPIGGFFTMDVQAAANAARAIKPHIVIPMHEMKKSPDKLRDLLQDELSNLQVIYLHNGETYEE